MVEKWKGIIIMKKITSLILAVVMVMSLSVNIFAADGITNGGSDSSEVRGTYSSEAVVTRYSVDISWKGLNFTYNGDFKGTWNTEKHEYENAIAAGWTSGSGTITITNHSNTDIIATPSYTAEEDYKSADMKFSVSALKVETADNGVDGASGTAVTKQITVSPSGSLPEKANNSIIGRITISIS